MQQQSPLDQVVALVSCPSPTAPCVAAHEAMLPPTLKPPPARLQQRQFAQQQRQAEERQRQMQQQQQQQHQQNVQALANIAKTLRASADLGGNGGGGGGGGVGQKRRRQKGGESGQCRNHYPPPEKDGVYNWYNNAMKKARKEGTEWTKHGLSKLISEIGQNCLSVVDEDPAKNKKRATNIINVLRNENSARGRTMASPLNQSLVKKQIRHLPRGRQTTTSTPVALPVSSPREPSDPDEGTDDVGYTSPSSVSSPLQGVSSLLNTSHSSSPGVLGGSPALHASRRTSAPQPGLGANGTDNDSNDDFAYHSPPPPPSRSARATAMLKAAVEKQDALERERESRIRAAYTLGKEWEWIDEDYSEYAEFKKQWEEEEEEEERRMMSSRDGSEDEDETDSEVGLHDDESEGEGEDECECECESKGKGKGKGEGEGEAGRGGGAGWGQLEREGEEHGEGQQEEKMGMSVEEAERLLDSQLEEEVQRAGGIPSPSQRVEPARRQPAAVPLVPQERQQQRRRQQQQQQQQQQQNQRRARAPHVPGMYRGMLNL